jgi:RNA polymerase sigma-70 factor (ECF subfamily)
VTDVELLKLFERNPEAALEKIMNHYGGLVYFIVSNQLSASCLVEDIEECVIDVFHEVYKRRNTIDLDKGSIKGFIAVLAKRKAISIYRSMRNRSGRIVSMNEMDFDENLSDSVHTEQIVMNKERQNDIIQMIQSLGEPDCEIFIRKYYFGQSTKSIAKDLGIKENTIDKKVSRGHIKLRELLGGFL